MISRFLASAGLTCWMLVPGPARQVRAAQSYPAATVADSIVRRFADSTGTPALSVALAREGRIVYAIAVGYLNLEDSVRADTATLFRIASVTKPITATLVMRLAEAERLDLDAPIRRYCPQYPPKRWPVTSRQLLSHTGGVPDYAQIERGVWWMRTHAGRVEGSNPFHYHELRDAVRIFADDSLHFEPGTRFAYTNVGFLLLGCAVEGAARQTYDHALEELVLRPADMRRVRPDDAWRIIPNRARTYQGRRSANATWWWWTRAQKEELVVDSLYNTRYEDTSIKLPAGGLLATAPDLARFGSALLAGHVLERRTRETMWTPQLTTAGDSTGWTLGWTPGLDGGRRTIGLSGGQPGVSAQLRVYRDDDLTIAAIANRDLVNLTPLSSALARLWLDPAGPR